MTRTLIAPLLTSVAFALAAGPSGAQDRPEATSVDGRPLDRAALAAEARRLRERDDYEPDAARQVATEVVVERAWVRGELAALGIAVPEAMVAAAQARERRAHGRDFASDRRSEGLSLGRWREAVRANVERRLLFDRLYASASDDAAYERVFLDWAERWRARTTCAPPYVSTEVCGDRPPPRERCDTLGFVSACFFPARNGSGPFWSIFDDVVWIAGTYNNHEAEDVLLPRLRRERPAISRAVEWDSDADFISVIAKQRAPLAAFARWLHGLALRRPTQPVLLEPE